MFNQVIKQHKTWDNITAHWHFRHPNHQKYDAVSALLGLINWLSLIEEEEQCSTVCQYLLNSFSKCTVQWVGCFSSSMWVHTMTNQHWDWNAGGGPVGPGASVRYQNREWQNSTLWKKNHKWIRSVSIVSPRQQWDTMETPVSQHISVMCRHLHINANISHQILSETNDMSCFTH